MTHRIAEIDQAALRQQQDALAVREFDFVHLRLHVVPLEVLQTCDLDFAIEVTDIADDRAVLHLAHMIDGNYVDVARCRHEDVGARGGVVHGDDLVTLHRRLQGADRIDFRDQYAATALAQ